MAATLPDSGAAIRWLVALLLVAPACSQSSNNSARPFESAQQALRRGALDEALSHVARGVAATDTDRQTPAIHQLRLLQVEILVAKPDLNAAAALLETPVPDGPEFAALRARERYMRARVEVGRAQLKQALATLATIDDLDPPQDVHIDAEVLAGQALLRLGRVEEGQARLKKVLEEAERRGDRYRQVLALNNLGMSLVRNRPDEALSWFQRVLSFQDLAEMSVYGTAMNNAGACFARLGHLERAVAIQKEAVSMQERRGAAGPYEQALGELGSTYLLANDLPEAVRHLTDALAIATKAGLMNDAAIWARNLAAAYTELRQWDDAERATAEARRLTPPEQTARLAFNILHEANIARGRGNDEAAAPLYQSLINRNDLPSVQWAAHEGLGVIAREQGNPRRAAAHLDQALAIIERTRSDLLRADDRLSFVTRLTRFYRQYVDLLVDQGEIERALAVADSSRGRVLAERHGVATPAGQNPALYRQLAARSNSVFVSYWLGSNRSYAWVVDAKSVRMHRLPSLQQIEPLIRKHQEAVHTALADPLATGGPGDQLKQLLVTPLLDSLKPGTALIIVPDGPLHGLNFETLPASGNPRQYWIHEVEIQVAPSLGLLKARQESPQARSLLVIGNPTPRDPEFPALRHASTEMNSIVSHFGSSSLSYEGPRASPVALREAGAEQFSLVHFTAHATANRESPLDSAVILSGPDDAFKLYARDVADLPLRAELVTVSACRSAGERVYSGEGLVGFAWAFLRAGARRVVAGLWDVDDRSTAELMDLMYGRLAAGEPPQRALRAAKLALMAKGGVTAKPYYWGPFQVFTVSAN